jgi:hypothetical protein
MREGLNELGALAHERAAAEVSSEQHAAGRQRLMARAADINVRASTRWRRSAIVTALAAAAAVALFFAFARPRPLAFNVRGADLQASNYLSAPASKPADVSFSDGSQIHVEPGTRLRIDQTRSNGARVLIENGVATANVKHAERANWQFVAGPFEVHVTGTRFTLGWDPLKEEVDLVLHEGSVEVDGPLARGRFAVRAGQRFRASLADGSMQVNSANAKASLKSTPPMADLDPSALPGPKPEPTPSPSNADASRFVPHPKTSSNSPASEALRESWPELVRRGQFQAVVRAAEARGIEASLGSSSAADVRALADAARYSGQSTLATQSLLALRRRFLGSSDASASAFLLGRMNESSHKFAEADGWYDTYLRESPRGQFASDALAGRMRCVAATGGAAAAKPLALEYLRRYPDGVHAPAARKLGGFD